MSDQTSTLIGTSKSIVRLVRAPFVAVPSRWRVPLVHVLVPRHHRAVDGIVFQRDRRLEPADVVVHRGIPVTTVARTLVDLSDVLTPHQLAFVMHQAAFRRRFSVAATMASIKRANGRWSLGVLKEAITRTSPGAPGRAANSKTRSLHCRKPRRLRSRS